MKYIGVTAECAWACGPDVLVCVGELPFPVIEVDEGYSFGISSEQARVLAAELVHCADRADELNREYEELTKPK